MSSDLYNAHRAAIKSQRKPPDRRQIGEKMWGYTVRGGVIGMALFLALSACFVASSWIGKPSFTPVGALFWALSASPVSWFLKMHWSLPLFAALNWAISGAVVGAITGYRKSGSKMDAEDAQSGSRR